MRGNSPSTALNGYLDLLNHAFTCVSRSVLTATSYRPSPNPADLLLNRGFPLMLRGGVLPISLRFEQQYHFAEIEQARASERWQVAVQSYRYTIYERGTDRELFAFHWHPEGGEISFPHLHLGSRILSEQAIAGRHIPTGAIGVSDLLRFLIAELGVAPGRPNWEQVLAETGAALAGAFTERATGA